MSSMFKKKGGLAFKPKIPTARPRPANPPSAPVPKTVTESQSPLDPVLDTASHDSPDVPGSALQSLQALPSDVQSAAESPERSSHATPDHVPNATEQSPFPEARPPSGSSTERGSTVAAENVASTADNISSTSGEAAGVTNAVADSVVGLVDPSLESVDGSGTTTAQIHAPPTATSPVPPPEAHTESSSKEQPPHEGDLESTPRSAPDAGAQTSPAAPTAVPPAVASASDTTVRPPNGRAKRTRKAKESKEDEEGTTRPQKRRRKKPDEQGADAAPRPRSRKRQAGDTAEDGSEKISKPRKARSPTPEDAEDQVVDLQQLKMADLTKDLRIGKKFSRHDELRDRERQARAKAKLQKDGDQTDGAASASASPKPDGPTASGSRNDPDAPAGPQFRIVDGQIVVDQNSLVMDRHARAAAAQARDDMETVEENDFTRLITSSSYMTSSKLKGPNIWTDEETELFYRGLRMFGTEFEMISKMFPGKQRRHIKLKFNREERHNPKRIDAALIGEKTIKMDIDEYRAFTGAEFESVETIEAEQRKIEESYEEERQRIADEQAEMMRKKREELFADDRDDGKRKRGGKKKGKRPTVAYGLNGEPIAQDG